MPFRRLGEPFRGLGKNLGAPVGGGIPYFQRVINYAPIRYWPLWDLSGLSATELIVGDNGTYSAGVTLGANGIGDGKTGIATDADNVNLYSAALNASFNPALFSIMIWTQITNPGVWIDATNRWMFQLRADVNNRLYFYKTTTNNQVRFDYIAGGTNKNVVYSTSGPLTYLSLLATVSKVADEMKFFVNGAQVGVTQTGLGNWVGALTSTVCTLAASNTSSASPNIGNLAHAVLWNKIVTPAEVASLGNPF